MRKGDFCGTTYEETENGVIFNQLFDPWEWSNREKKRERRAAEAEWKLRFPDRDTREAAARKAVYQLASKQDTVVGTNSDIHSGLC